jgi:hypothetical protein
MTRERGSFVILVVTLCVGACEKSGPSTDPDAATAVDVIVEAEPAAAVETPEQACARMLERFGPEVAEAQLGPCVAATSTSSQYALCQEAGLLDDYLSCFEGCVASIEVDDPVDNCEPGCAQTTCE